MVMMFSEFPGYTEVVLRQWILRAINVGTQNQLKNEPENDENSPFNKVQMLRKDYHGELGSSGLTPSYTDQVDQTGPDVTQTGEYSGLVSQAPKNGPRPKVLPISSS